ncbi:MAG: AraC family transcriptional regulator [Desulfobacteraceae bacterium]|jgi:AraC-like DNA-binding protein
MVINAEELFGSYSNLGEPQDIKENPEIYWEWPGEIGNGTMSLINLRPGIYIETGNYRLKEDVAICFEQTHHSLSLTFSFSGNMKYKVDSGTGQHEYWGFKQGHIIMGYLSKGQHNTIRPSVGIRACNVNISVDPRLISTFIDDQYDRIPVELRNIVNGAEDQHFYQSFIMPPVVNTAIQQIISCPYRSSLKKLFLEGKALELISYSLAQLSASADVLQKNIELCPADAERILEARNILIRDLEDPPSLQELARQVGTNKNKLNKGFRQIFGTSVFDYLRIRRLEQAKELLDSKKMNVCEAALHVGYSQQSSFTRAFKNHFGTIPTGHLH